MRLYILFLLFITRLAAAQSTGLVSTHPCATAKVERYARYFGDPQGRLAASSLAYPGNGSIDISYYGLNLNITHTPTVTVGLRRAPLINKQQAYNRK